MPVSPLRQAWPRWWRAPWWAFAILTGGKSFFDNPILASPRLNRTGLHLWRKRTAHALAERRRAAIAPTVDPAVRAEFDRDGFVVIPDFLDPAAFAALQAALLDTPLDTRQHQQGDTITRRVAVGPDVRTRFPALGAMLDSPRWRGVMAYVGSTRAAPIYYIQTIVGGVNSNLPDPQVHLHSDTFHPSLKAWLFLTDVADDGRPLTYVAGSHRLTPQRAAWEQAKVLAIDSGRPAVAARLAQGRAGKSARARPAAADALCGAGQYAGGDRHLRLPRPRRQRSSDAAGRTVGV